jgi:integrase
MSTDGLPEGEQPRWRDPDGRPVVPHGFRSSFRMWAGENRVEDREVIERCLAHAVEGDVEAAYQRDDYLARRRPVMELWAAFAAGGA